VPTFRADPRRSSREMDPDYLAWLRTQTCRAYFLIADLKDRCNGRMEADHVGMRGLGQKCSDSECLTLCQRHHRDRHGLTGVFAGWSRERMHEWFEVNVRAQRSKYLHHTMEGM
jgi:hypothetical protein